MWVGGDGSTRSYTLASPCLWQAENLNRIDQVVCSPSVASRHIRLLANHTQVVFDPFGRHQYTVNRLCDTTEFTYTPNSQVASIVVPPRSGGSGAATYLFHYGATSGLLDSVSAPPLNASTPRRVRITWNNGVSSFGRILRFDDPDATAVAFHYSNDTQGQGDYRIAGRVNRRGVTTTYTYGTAVAHVAVDAKTGHVDVVDYVVVDDVGRVLNPMLVKGQLHGGIVQGIGQALTEVIRYDPDSGQMLSGSFMDYAMPRADDVSSFEIQTNEVLTPTNPLGSKGAGEAGTVGALPCVMNAINDALRPLGIRHFEMPATPMRVWQAIRDAKS
jgi:CO/xanthine dehydrogenase Mo-binding subunit